MGEDSVSKKRGEVAVAAFLRIQLGLTKASKCGLVSSESSDGRATDVLGVRRSIATVDGPVVVALVSNKNVC